MNAGLTPLLTLSDLIRSLDAFGRQYATLLDEYEEMIYVGLAQLLSALGGLSMNLERSTDEQAQAPYHDFGAEPETREEAIARLPEFLEQIGWILREGSGPADVTMTRMRLRAGTFAQLLAEGNVTL